MASEDHKPGSGRPDDSVLAVAEQTLDHVRMLWDDAVGYAETLREKRKLYSTGIALILGIGVFRVSWYRSVRDVSAIADPTIELCIKLLVTVALTMLGIAAWHMFTERPVFRRWAVRRIARMNFRAARIAARSRLLAWNRFDTRRHQRASTHMDIPSDVMDRLEEFSPGQLMRIRAERIRTAYARLVQANDRVNRRIMRGVVWMGLSFAVFGIAAVWYSFSIDRVSGERHGPVEARERGFGQADPNGE